MSSDRLTRPSTGTAAGTGYLALPPTAVDATPAGPARLVIAWPGFEPPRTAAALSAAVPMTGVPVWRVYLDLPTARPVAGLTADRVVETYGAAVEDAVERLPDVLAELHRELGLEPGPIGLVGFSAGAGAALLALSAGTVEISAAALIAPVTVRTAVAAYEKRTGRPYEWTEEAREIGARLDLSTASTEVAPAPILLIGGSRDRLVPPPEVIRLGDALTERGAATVEAVTFRMAHALAAEPGLAAHPPTAEAVSVDAAITDWFREHLAKPTPNPQQPPTTTQEPLTAPQQPAATTEEALAGAPQQTPTAVAQEALANAQGPSAAAKAALATTQGPAAGEPLAASQEPSVAAQEDLAASAQQASAAVAHEALANAQGPSAAVQEALATAQETLAAARGASAATAQQAPAGGQEPSAEVTVVDVTIFKDATVGKDATPPSTEPAPAVTRDGRAATHEFSIAGRNAPADAVQHNSPEATLVDVDVAIVKDAAVDEDSSQPGIKPALAESAPQTSQAPTTGDASSQAPAGDGASFDGLRLEAAGRSG